MKALVASALLASTLVFAAPLEARDRFDVGKMRCSEAIQLAQDDEDAFALIVIWIDGYLSGITGDTNFDVKFLERFTEQLILTCSRSDRKRVLDVAREVGIR
jgi:acid stress chaperone HdeB